MRHLDDADGKRIAIHQTDLNRFRKCPESARKIMAGEVIDLPGEEAMRGILAHSMIAALVDGEDPDEYLLKAYTEELPRFQEAGIELPPSVMAGASEAFALFEAANGHELLGNRGEIVEAEVYFEFDTGLTSADGRSVVLRGSSDLVLVEEHLVRDWKFSAAYHWEPREFWKHERYDVQPLIYMGAMAEATGTPIERWAFEYVTIDPVTGRLTRRPQIRRTQADFERLLVEIAGVIRLLDTNPEGPWPMHPTDWHCSPAFCSAFRAYQCMGQFAPPSWVINTKDGRYDEWLNGHPMV